MMLSSDKWIRKTTEWYKNLFFHLTYLSLLKVHFMYLMHSGNHRSLKMFQLKVVQKLLENCHQEKNVRREEYHSKVIIQSP